MGRCINLRVKVLFVMVAGRNYGFDEIASPRICQPHPWMPQAVGAHGHVRQTRRNQGENLGKAVDMAAVYY